jgi:hypothetical protein
VSVRVFRVEERVGPVVAGSVVLEVAHVDNVIIARRGFDTGASRDRGRLFLRRLR